VRTPALKAGAIPGYATTAIRISSFIKLRRINPKLNREK